MKYDVHEILEKIVEKEKEVAVRTKGKIPYTTVDGVFDDKSYNEKSKDGIGWWTNGFWGGLMWQLYHLDGFEQFRENAEFVENQLDRCFLEYNHLDHDNGFKWLQTSVGNYRLFQNEQSLNRGLLAATNLAGRFNTVGKFIRAWNDRGDDADRRGWAIIDCMMNLPLLYWASEVTNDPRFRQIAMAHADTAMENFVRPDGSCEHIVEFNLTSGEKEETYGGQGYEAGSSWTRGQAWALYGFALSYKHTGEQKYLDTAKQVAHYFISNIPQDGLIPVDFRQPAEPMIEDSTASAIAACGLLEIAKFAEGRDKDLYTQYAERLLEVLIEKRCNLDKDIDNLLEKCTEAYHRETGIEISIIYGDYFFLEALMKLNNDVVDLW